MKKNSVKRALLAQLRAQHKEQSFYLDLVNDYMSYWDIKQMLIEDISEKGVRYPYTNGNGIESEKPNESILNLNKTTAMMLKILADLNLREPTKVDSNNDDYL